MPKHQECENCNKPNGFMEYALYHNKKKRVYCSEQCFIEGVEKMKQEKEEETFVLSDYIQEINNDSFCEMPDFFEGCSAKNIRRTVRLVNKKIEAIATSQEESYDVANEAIKIISKTFGGKLI